MEQCFRKFEMALYTDRDPDGPRVTVQNMPESGPLNPTIDDIIGKIKQRCRPFDVRPNPASVDDNCTPNLIFAK